MKKYVFLILLLIGMAVVIYLTFVIAMIKIAIGSVFLGIMALAILGLWITWKKKTDD